MSPTLTQVPASEFVEKGLIRKDRGLLPYPDPLKTFPPEYAAFKIYDETAAELPQLLYNGAIRARLKNLPLLPVEKLEGPAAVLAFRHLCFMTSAYAWADCVKDLDAPHAGAIPQSLAVPLNTMAQKLGMMPILAYAMYATNNFEILNPRLPIRFDNLRLLQHFTIPPWDRDEKGFILPHVEIEAEAGPGLCALPQAQWASLKEDKALFVASMNIMRDSLQEMVQTLKNIPNVCSPEVYFIHVRPWIFYFQKITYEGVGYFERLKGETGAESPAIISFDTAMGIAHEKTELIDHLKELKQYRTPTEAGWLAAIEGGPSIKEFAGKHKTDPSIKTAFNEVHESIIAFRRQHFDTAVKYIKEKGRGAVATGGTHYELFLGKLIDETRANMI